jgi:hypothetical protein
MMLLTVVHTMLEDRALMNEVDGYQDRAKRVRYRFLSGVC